MLAKISRKNQLTLPRRVVDQLGFSPDEEKYVNVEVHGNTAIMKPVVVTIEEKMSEEQAEEFRSWALKHESGDVSFDSAEKATKFLKNRMKKK